MGRPELEPGTHGRIKVTEVDGGRWRARTMFRDYTGVRREISRYASGESEAHQALTTALRDWASPSDDDVTRDTRVRELAKLWLDYLEDTDATTGTRRLYAGTVERHVLPALGALRIREVTVQRLDRTLRALRKDSGAGTAKATRSVLSGMFGYAVRYGAMTSNPARDTSPIPRKARKQVRALTIEETVDLRLALAESERARTLDLPDLVDWMLATGMRIGEVCAVRKASLTDETVWVNATVVRVKGEGLMIQEWPKSAAGNRVLPLSDGLRQMLARRAATPGLRGPQGVVFCSPRGRLRDPSNTSNDLREVLDAAGFEWVTSHTFRKTVATRLDEAGFTGREVADVLGHEKPSMTQDVYMGRKVVSPRMTKALNLP